MFSTPTKKVNAFLVRVVYKSGATIDFYAKSFEWKGSRYEWEAVGEIRPIQFGADDVSAVWQMGYHEIDTPANPNEGAQPQTQTF